MRRCSLTKREEKLKTIAMFLIALPLVLLFAGCESSPSGPFAPSIPSSQWNQVSGPATNLSEIASVGNAIVVGTGSGYGLFKSFDGGNTWSQSIVGLVSRPYLVEIGFQYSQVSAMLTVGTDIYLGTSPDGMYISSDYGWTWSQINNGVTYPYVSSLTSDGRRIFAGTYGGGIFATSDKGAHWSDVSAGLPFFYVGTWKEFPYVYALAANSAPTSNDVYAGTPGGVYVSTNGGTSWNLQNIGLSDSSITALFVQDGVAYAGTFGGNVYRSTDTGAHWTSIGGNLIGQHAIIFLVGHSSQLANTSILAGTAGGLYSWAGVGSNWRSLYGSTWVSSIADYPNGILAVAGGDAVILSTDDGMNWSELNPVRDVQALASVQDPSGTMNVFAATGHGIFRSSDEGISWTNTSAGLTNMHIMRLVASGNDLFAGSGAWDASFTGGVFHSTDLGRSWTPINGGLTSTNIVSLAVCGSSVLAGTYDGVTFLLNDPRIPWVRMNTGISGTPVTAVAIVSPKSLGGSPSYFAGTSSGIYRSTDNGGSWTNTSGDLVNHYVVSIGVEGTKVYVGTDRGELLQSTDLGSTWAVVKNAMGSLSYRGPIFCVVTKDSNVYVGSLTGVLCSTDNGTNWLLYEQGMTYSGNATALALTNSHVYAGGYNGIWRMLIGK